MQEVDLILVQKNIRITAMRQLVIEYFLSEKKPVGLKKLETDFPKSDRITIYRTLKTFQKKGLLHKIENGTSEIKFALCEDRCNEQQHFDNHPHFHCLSCEEIACLEAVKIPEISLPKTYQILESNLLMKGFCGNCVC